MVTLSEHTLALLILLVFFLGFQGRKWRELYAGHMHEIRMRREREANTPRAYKR